MESATRDNTAWPIEPIHCMADLEERVARMGFLPMFRSGIRGYSVYEATPNFWTDGDDGPWEWKGPVIRNGECAYGKFFNRKAVWISREWLPDFLNYRRTLHLAPNEDMAALQDLVLQVIQTEGEITSTELSRLLGLTGKRGKRKEGELVDNLGPAPKVNLDPIVARLMMEGRVTIADFVYNIDKRGNRYGWGIAKYTTPEALYGLMETSRTPQESRQRILEHLRQMLPTVSEKALLRLIS